MAKKIWGVDSAAPVTEELFSCVMSQLGKPAYWGRYLSTVPNVSDGLSKEEINFIQKNGIKIIPIYNDFKEAVGFEKGQVIARNAIFHAQRLGIPKGVFLFANIEDFFNVDEGWIRGWVETFYPSGYKPGIYHDPEKGSFSEAYCQAVAKDSKVASQTVLWSSSPRPGTSNKENAPEFKPASPPCKANVWIWQYGRDAKRCPVDTNLMDQRLLKNLL